MLDEHCWIEYTIQFLNGKSACVINVSATLHLSCSLSALFIDPVPMRNMLMIKYFWRGDKVADAEPKS